MVFPNNLNCLELASLIYCPSCGGGASYAMTPVLVIWCVSNDFCLQVGRVKIQVYRGPSKGEGYDVFAPWGYYNTQPADLGHASYH